jgi:hypothetical protein
VVVVVAVTAAQLVQVVLAVVAEQIPQEHQTQVQAVVVVLI